ncbi:hypothetical protein FRB94_006345 [Tulasnella sp. JGI-2019a]|nr:hypothetical protein FRB94_006345 [Tulasnella sp. JGI-2019a]
MAKAIVSWPSEYMTRLVTRSLREFPDNFSIVSDLPDDDSPLLQWSTYDDISHSLTLQSSRIPSSRRVLSSSYTIRKALIRKHFLHRTFTNYSTKYPESVLGKAVPRTWSIDLAFADELDELWSDELWELGQMLDHNAETQSGHAGNCWILKPGMADRGMGIRLFHDKAGLMKIFESFEDPESDEEAEQVIPSSNEDNTSVAMSQLRHFVIQEYLPNPLLIDPTQAKVAGSSEMLPRSSEVGAGRKFHLRAYFVASGALKLYLCPNILALFASSPYTSPEPIAPRAGLDGDEEETIDLRPHLTNTSLQSDKSDTEVQTNVRLLDELIGCRIYPIAGDTVAAETMKFERRFSSQDVSGIIGQVTEILSDTFQAALAMPVHFQPLSNAFEIFGADLLITYSDNEDSFQVHILEMNAEPAIELTGSRLQWILDDFFRGVADVCVRPLLFPEESNKCGAGEKEWEVGEVRHGLIKCLDVRVWGCAAQ